MIDEQRLNLIKELNKLPLDKIQDDEREYLKFTENNLMDVIDNCYDQEVKRVWYKKFNWLQLNISYFLKYYRYLVDKGLRLRHSLKNEKTNNRTKFN